MVECWSPRTRLSRPQMVCHLESLNARSLLRPQVLAPNGITWRRLDGSVKPEHRFAVVQQFNADPTIDVMLLTTAVRACMSARTLHLSQVTAPCWARNHPDTPLMS